MYLISKSKVRDNDFEKFLVWKVDHISERLIDICDIELENVSLAIEKRSNTWYGPSEIPMHKLFDICTC